MTQDAAETSTPTGQAGASAETKAGRPVLEIAIGSAAVAIAGVAWLLTGTGTLGADPVTMVNTAPEPERVIVAHEAGIDITGGRPSKSKERLLEVFHSGNVTPFNDLAFSSGIYTNRLSSTVFTGYVADRYEDGSPRLLGAVVDGRLEGPAVGFWPNGRTKFSRTYRAGRAVGQILEFYENGDMKLRVVAGERSNRGGTQTGEITAGMYDEDGYAQKSLGTGRIQFIFDDGTTNSTNDSMALEKQEGFMLFYDTMFGQEALTSDSRRMLAPLPAAASAEEPAANATSPDDEDAEGS